MIKILELYKSYKTFINAVSIIVLILALGTCALKRQYNKGVSDGKVAVRVDNVNQTTKEVRKNIKEAVFIVTDKLEKRIDEIDRLEKENVIPEITDPVLKEEYENPDLGISEEMFAAINKARAETNK